MNKSLLTLSLMVVVAVGVPICSRADTYVAHVLSSWGDSSGSDINDSGQTVGWIQDNVSGNSSAVKWDGYDAEPLTLVHDGGCSSADFINNSGSVMGRVYFSGHERLCLWNAAGDLNNLGPLPAINAMNEQGTMVGFGVGDSREVPVVVSTEGRVSCLDNLLGVGGEATGINDSGYIIGYSLSPTGFGGHACLWHKGSDTIDIGTFGGTWSDAVAINNHNQVVGVYGDNEHGIGNFIWTPNGDTLFIPSSPSLDGSDFGPIDINDNGVVLGQAQVNGVDTVVTWSLAGGLTIVGPGEASAINNFGYIVGTTSLNTPRQAVVWTPIPEPSSLLALLAGLGGFGAIIRRRRR